MIYASVLIFILFTSEAFYQLPYWSKEESFLPATLTMNPISWKFQHNYAHFLSTQNNYEKAIEHFKLAVQLRPISAAAYNDFGLVYLNIEHGSQAVALFQQSLRLRPTPEAANNLGLAFLMLNQPRQALEAFHLGMLVEPNNFYNIKSLAWILATYPDDSIRNGKEALQLASDIVMKTHGEVPLFVLTLAAAEAEVGNFPAAIAAAQEAEGGFEHAGDTSKAEQIKNITLPYLQQGRAIREVKPMHAGSFTM